MQMKQKEDQLEAVTGKESMVFYVAKIIPGFPQTLDRAPFSHSLN